ncbi:hypothetical protein M569_12603 [Genlisea aurea]|uniref:DDE Tnp4 domain-containing protein n=1 Tax=Genlisea aurea TaxID=192259 RepID=S8DH80_9LAMI|nr:hypothetical protein M569_12603 [Genlisea aurea]
MGPIRNNKKRKVEKKADENNNNNSAVVSGSSSEDFAELWDVFSMTLAGVSSSLRASDEFGSGFRMSRTCFDYISELVKDHMMAKTHFAFSNGKLMSLNDQVALALTRLGSGNSLISIGGSFGAHHSTVSQITWRFIEAVEEHGLRHLQWPHSTSEIKRRFEAAAGLPNCCGAIDTTHITMLLTSSDQESETWLDRKQSHSMILQAVVGPDMRFLNVVAGWPGKMDDASVLRSSDFFKQCQNGKKLNGPKIRLSEGAEEEEELGEYLVGDSGFPLLPWLMTPFRGDGLSEGEAAFNGRVVETHAVAKRALSRLKRVWRMIQGEMWRPDKHKLPRFILACCILHNILIEIDGGDGFDDEEEPEHDPGYKHLVCDAFDKAALVLRDKLCMHFSR